RIGSYQLVAFSRAGLLGQVRQYWRYHVITPILPRKRGARGTRARAKRLEAQAAPGQTGDRQTGRKKTGSFYTSCFCIYFKTSFPPFLVCRFPFHVAYSSSSNVIASRVVASSSYSSLLP